MGSCSVNCAVEVNVTFPYICFFFWQLKLDWKLYGLQKQARIFEFAFFETIETQKCPIVLKSVSILFEVGFI